MMNQHCGLSPHVDVKGLEDVDLEASRPGAVGCVHEPHTQQLVVVIPGPVEDHAGAWQGGDVALWVGGALTQVDLSIYSRVRCWHHRNFVQTSVFLLFLSQTPSEQKPVCEWTCCPAGSEEQRSQCECLCSDLFLSTH